MKKSFSVLLSAALAFGSFASLTSAAELTAKEKFDALKAKGIFTGVNAAGDAGLDQNMNRAQFARVAALILGLEGIGNPDTLKVTEKPFPDVDLGKWYTEEVAAVKAAKVLVGNADGTFNPEGNISVQELAVVTANLLGLKAVEGAKVEGAADWAAGYIKAILDAGVSFPTNYTEAATRGQLVELSFQADAKLNPVAPAKVSVASAKATGVKTVEVALDKAVDDTKAKLTLKRNGSTVATTAKWSDDKKSATLTLDSAKILEGDYTVTLEGVDDIATATASFKAENEKVSKLEFVAPSDTVAQSDHARVDFQALNQYGENVSLAAGSFNAYSNAVTTIVKKDANGKLYVELDTNDSTLIPNVSQISINLINTDSQITVNKSFKLGSQPYVTKVELGNVTYSNGETYLSKSGDKAVIELLQYDQYGNRITTQSGSLFNASANVTPYLTEIGNPSIVDDNNDNILDVVVQLSADSKATGEYTVSVFGGNTATKVINVKSTKYAASIELDTSVVLAASDTGVYIPLTAYDKDGNKLSAQDIVTNYTSGHFQITTSSNLTLNTTPGALFAAQGGQLAIIKAGEHKGQLYIDSVGAKGIANVFVNITPSSANGIIFNKNFQLNIQEKRYPVSLKVSSSNAPKAIPAGGNATSNLKVVAIDQYGAEINKTIGNIQENSKTVTYDVYVENLSVVGSGVALSGYGALGAHANLADVLGHDLPFVATAGAAAGDELNVKISLRKIDVNTNTVIDNAVSTVTKGMKVIPTTSRLTYSVDGIDTLFAAIDDPAMNGAADAVATSKHARSVSISAKDGAADSVALPSNYVVGVSSADTRIVDTDGIRGIIGNKAGTTQLSVTYLTVDGGSSTTYKEVVVKSDTISVASLSANAQAEDLATNLTNAATIMNLKVKDNYNTEYATADIATYDKLLGIRYSVSDVQGVTVTVSPTGTLVVTGTGSFTLTASAPNGKTAVTAVIVD